MTRTVLSWAPMPRALKWLNAAVLIGVVVSGLAPHDRITWLLEISPLCVLMPLLWYSHSRFPLTPMLYAGIGLQMLGLLVGAAYTFPRVPIGEWLVAWFDLSRNPYDRIGHFVQGFVPAMAAREILVRGRHVCGARMLPFLSVCIVMTFSATYELVEWMAAITLGKDADDFLGMQGDPWDAQADMLCAFAGAIVMLVWLPRRHDAQIRTLLRAQEPGRAGR